MGDTRIKLIQYHTNKGKPMKRYLLHGHEYYDYDKFIRQLISVIVLNGTGEEMHDACVDYRYDLFEYIILTARKYATVQIIEP